MRAHIKVQFDFKQGAKSHAIQNLDRHHDVKFVKNLPLMGVLAEKNKVVFVTHREDLVNQIFPLASISTGTAMMELTKHCPNQKTTNRYYHQQFVVNYYDLL